MPRAKTGLTLARTTITGRSRSYDRLNGDRRLHGYWILFEILTYAKSGHLDRVVVRGVWAEDEKKAAFAAQDQFDRTSENSTSVEYIMTPEEARMPHILGAAS